MAKKSTSKASEELNQGALPKLLGYHLRRAQLASFSDFSRTVSGQQITPGQYGVLILIANNPGLSQSSLARTIGVERSTMVAVIDGLEKRSLVERRPSPIDRRSNALYLTAMGNAMLEELEPLVKEHDKRIAEPLSASEKATLIELLMRLSESR